MKVLTIPDYAFPRNELLVLAPILCLSLLFGLAGCSQEHKDKANSAKAIELARRHLSQHDYRHAYDAVLAAMRLDPTEPTVLDVTLEFVSKASKASNGADVDKQETRTELARDLYSRADALIPFQPLNRLAAARDQYIATGVALESPHTESSGTQPAHVSGTSPFEEFERQLAVVGNTDTPSDVRVILLQRARAELDGLAVLMATGAANEQNAAGKQSSNKDFWTRWNDAKKSLESKEKSALSATYDEFRQEVLDWGSESKEKIAKADTNLGDKGIETISALIDPMLERAVALRQQLAPYVDGQLSKAQEDNRNLIARTRELERSREWLYNAYAIAEVKAVEASKDKALEKLKRLSAIEQERLTGFAAERLQNVWKKLYEGLKEDDKVNATKESIIRHSQRS